MSGIRYRRQTIAYAIERVVNGESMLSVSKSIGCANGTVSKWMDKYYFFKRGTAVLTKESKV